ncbi:hypothetical protein GGR92_003511 [Spirosoma lacussanchae]|uniref:hypothetical protein n=1 Tax=Spirosoma lacussanchae TaxID=1884249 RepID=UPI001109CCFC|nr:hypothetical protein [Spirosoma lacussanchae]
MARIVLLLFLTASLGVRAHNPQLSTMALVQGQDKTWTLNIGASLAAFQYELQNSYPDQGIDQLDADAFQKKIIEHLRHTIHIQAGSGRTIQLAHGMIRLGHQTDVRFEVTGMPDQLQTLQLRHLGFSTLKNQYCVLTIQTPATPTKTCILQDENAFVVSLKADQHTLVETPPEQPLNWPIPGIACAILLALVLYRMQVGKQPVAPV